MLILKSLRWIVRSLWRLLNFTRQMTFNLLFILIVAATIFTFSRSNLPLVPIKGALTINLNGTLVEQRTQTDPTELVRRQIGNNDDQPSEIVLSDLRWAIQTAKDDDRIKALVLKTEGLAGTSLNMLLEAAAAIDEFKSSGKPVIAMADFYSQGQYLLASHADQILLNQHGAVAIEGFGSYHTFFRSALEKFNITPHIFRVGTFKSAVEPFLRDDMSLESKEAESRWLNQLWQSYLADVATQREISPDLIAPNKDQYLTMLRKAGGNAARYALNNGLVDELLTRDEMVQTIINLVGEDDNRSWNSVSLQDYLAAIPTQYPQHSQASIGLIVASGTIMDGEQPAGTIGGDTLATLIADARHNEQIKAVVLRVNTPGGSAFAAEQIRAELLALKASGKPVVISMASTAASGGYWIAADADKIFASPTTLTGSIGVFGMFATIDKALAQVGIYNDGVGTTDHTGVGLTRPLPDHISQAIQLSVENTYQQFLDIVSNGRGLTAEQAKKAAQGRVWTGFDAKALGLIDEFGNLDDAIAAAADMANLDEWQVTPISIEESPTEKLLRQLFNSSVQLLMPHLNAMLPSGLSQLLFNVNQAMDPLTKLNDPKGNYALCPQCTP